MKSVKHDTGSNYFISVVLKTRSGFTTAAVVFNLHQWGVEGWEYNFLVTGPENTKSFH